MNELQISADHRQIDTLLNILMEEMVVAAFTYAASFTVRLERNRRRERDGRPGVLVLDPKATWWIGEREAWDTFLASLPLRARRIDPQEPALAYRLMLLIGTTITTATLGADGTLTLATEDGEAITIQGTTAIWDESWTLYVPPDVPGHDQWYIECLPDGACFARWPKEPAS